MKDITFCKVCSIEINKSLLYDHIKSKEHKDNENYFIGKCMTYCEVCKKEIKNDEWREHLFSQSHLDLEEKKYCEFCHMKNDKERSQNKERKYCDTGFFHLSRGIHKKNVERFDFYNN